MLFCFIVSSVYYKNHSQTVFQLKRCLHKYVRSNTNLIGILLFSKEFLSVIFHLLADPHYSPAGG